MPSARQLAQRLLLAAHRHGPDEASHHCPGLPVRALWVVVGDESGMAVGVTSGGHYDICHDCGASPELVARAGDELSDLLARAIRLQDGPPRTPRT
jgi:hypothetical protein